MDTIVQGSISRRRNPLIADLLRRIHFIEACGRGVPLILENAPNAHFEDIGGLFITKFARQTTQETTQETAILSLLKERPELTTKQLAELTKLSTDGVKYHLKQLKDQGKLQRHGATKKGYWVVIDE